LSTAEDPVPVVSRSASVPCDGSSSENAKHEQRATKDRLADTVTFAHVPVESP
jgi:hypothetical protein